MDPLLKLQQIWSWLPHFRVVGEFENLTKASRRFKISPPALSKALARLEGELGVTLFRRHRGTLRLNDNGQVLLDAIRGAMRDIDDALGRMSEGRSPVRIRVAASAWVASECISAAPPIEGPWFMELLGIPKHPLQSLKGGELDALISHAPLAHPTLISTRLARIPMCVAAPSSHPLVAVQAQGQPISVAELTPYPFVAWDTQPVAGIRLKAMRRTVGPRLGGEPRSLAAPPWRPPPGSSPRALRCCPNDLPTQSPWWCCR